MTSITRVGVFRSGHSNRHSPSMTIATYVKVDLPLKNSYRISQSFYGNRMTLKLLLCIVRSIFSIFSPSLNFIKTCAKITVLPSKPCNISLKSFHIPLVFLPIRIRQWIMTRRTVVSDHWSGLLISIIWAVLLTTAVAYTRPCIGSIVAHLEL